MGAIPLAESAAAEQGSEPQRGEQGSGSLRKFSFAAALAVAGLISHPVHPAEPGLQSISTTVLTRLPLISGPLLSPDGSKILSRAMRAGQEVILMQPLDGKPMRLIPKPEKGEIAWYRWAGNGRILISIASTFTYFGEDARMTRLISYDLETGKIGFVGRKSQGPEGDDVLFVDPEGNHLVMQIQKTYFDWPSVYRVDLNSGAISEIVRSQQFIWEWFADNAGVVRAGISFYGDRWTLYYRKTEAEKFRKVVRARPEDNEAVLDLLRFNRDTDEGYVFSNEKTGRYALYKYDFAKRELGELIYESGTNDLSAVDMSDDGTKIDAVYFTDDQDRVVWFDAEMKQHQEQIDAALKGRQNRLFSRSRDGKRMLFWIGSPSDPGSYYLYRTDEGVLHRIAWVNQDLSKYRLSKTKPVDYVSRDGLTIRAYLTLPAGRGEKGLPLIIMPHGGPYDVRDKLAFDAEVQFLANRGYAVFQPNFRGSGGYGRAFYEKGEGQIGRAMQDDLDDGMDWLVKQGIADPKRVCIYGSSYGGYAALWGVTRNPERYRCAASFAGVTDLKRQLRYDVTYWISKRYRRNWRDKVKGADGFDLTTISPLYKAADMKMPVLLGHGKDDQTVLHKQSQLYADALKEAGRDVEFRSYEGVGHGFNDPANFEDWLNRLDAFLAKHNPA